jgi:hypothetical protein
MNQPSQRPIIQVFFSQQRAISQMGRQVPSSEDVSERSYLYWPSARRTRTFFDGSKSIHCSLPLSYGNVFNVAPRSKTKIDWALRGKIESRISFWPSRKSAARRILAFAELSPTNLPWQRTSQSQYCIEKCHSPRT